jgi:hypothetical protein
VSFAHLGGAALAVIAVGLGVAPADWDVGLVANLRNAHAGAGRIRAAALAGLRLAPSIRRACSFRGAAACLANVGGFRSAY